MQTIEQIYGTLVFTRKNMEALLSKEAYNKFLNVIHSDQKELVDLALANEIADAMKTWAISKGATHYTHWFQPMNSVTAAKHESFISINPDGTITTKFSGKELMRGETDGSSFPSGGLRSTFEARGYTAWDASSSAFIKNDTLYIPTSFFSYSGHTLDQKTPLHHSSATLRKQVTRLLTFFNKPVNKVTVTVGAEQEYFLISKSMFQKRLDLKLTGRTLFGARPPKTQELDDHYYGALRPHVFAFMRDLDEQLWRYGVPAKTRHNEVAPCQHELAAIYERVSVATDHNELIMEVIKEVAEQHGLICLLHEKPFANMNGSGKHNNWSISYNDTNNLLDPGKTPENNYLFLMMVACIVAAVDKYQDLLRISVANAGNDHRLGGNEAPPAILSIFLGQKITNIFEEMVANKKDKKSTDAKKLSVLYISDFEQDDADRNRTSPFAFTGNKFEFRMLGSSFNISNSNIALNTAVAEIMKTVCDQLEQYRGDDKQSMIEKIIADLYQQHSRIVFNGNNYSDEWKTEAKRRGLSNLTCTPDALDHYADKNNIDLFIRNKIFTEEELLSRQEVCYSEYAKNIKIESLAMLDIVKREIIVAATKFENELLNIIQAKRAIEVNALTEINLLKRVSQLNADADRLQKELVVELQQIRTINSIAIRAHKYHDNILNIMNQLRSACDELERIIPKHLWPFPTYADILFEV